MKSDMTGAFHTTHSFLSGNIRTVAALFFLNGCKNGFKWTAPFFLELRIYMNMLPFFNIVYQSNCKAKRNVPNWFFCCFNNTQTSMHRIATCSLFCAWRDMWQKLWQEKYVAWTAYLRQHRRKMEKIKIAAKWQERKRLKVNSLDMLNADCERKTCHLTQRQRSNMISEKWSLQKLLALSIA